MIWLGSSTKSCAMNDPEPRNRQAENRLWSVWPNSWNSVSDSSGVSSAGALPAGREKLKALDTIGVTKRPSLIHWSRTLMHHAPPRLPGRGWKSMSMTPRCRPSFSLTSNACTSGWYSGTLASRVKVSPYSLPASVKAPSRTASSGKYGLIASSSRSYFAFFTRSAKKRQSAGSREKPPFSASIIAWISAASRRARASAGVQSWPISA